MNKWHVYNNKRFFAVIPLLLHSQSFTIRENTYMRWWWFFYPSITLSISFMCQVFIRFKCSSMAYDYIFPFFFATSAVEKGFELFSWWYSSFARRKLPCWFFCSKKYEISIIWDCILGVSFYHFDIIRAIINIYDIESWEEYFQQIFRFWLL